jgi:hypothetical protein
MARRRQMKNVTVGLSVIVAFLAGFMAPTFAAEQKGDYSSEMQAKIEEEKMELKKFTDERATVKKNLVPNPLERRDS